jgi:serine/threonine protein kinase
MAPELVIKQDYGKLVDVWSVGIIMYMMFSKFKHPIYDGKMEMKKYIANLSDPKLDFSILDLSQKGQTLIQKMLQPKASLRCSADDCLRFPWLTGKDEEEIPLNPFELYLRFETSNNLRNVFKLLPFIIKMRSYNSTSAEKRQILNSQDNNNLTKDKNDDNRFIIKTVESFSSGDILGFTKLKEDINKNKES